MLLVMIPRSYIQGEAKKVEDTRQAILKAVDWDCEIHTLFQKRESWLLCGSLFCHKLVV